MNESLTHEQLSILKRARDILDETYCAWWSDHPDGVRHCAMGAISLATRVAQGWSGQGCACAVCRNPGLQQLMNSTARALHPELRGMARFRAENSHCGCQDEFNDNPAVFVNNHLGKQAILQVFDATILEAEIRLASAPMPEPEPDEQDDKAAALVAG